jgi:peroxiredoxin
MKGSLGPVFTAMTNRRDSISTKPNSGKAMILYFWSTDKFAPADFVRSDAEDAAAINTLYHKFYKQADFIGFPFNDSSTVNQYMKEHSLDFPQVMDKTTIGKENYISQYTTPLVIFINSKGRIVDIYPGSLRKKEVIIKKFTPIIQACISNSTNTK